MNTKLLQPDLTTIARVWPGHRRMLPTLALALPVSAERERDCSGRHAALFKTTCAICTRCLRPRRHPRTRCAPAGLADPDGHGIRQDAAAGRGIEAGAARPPRALLAAEEDAKRDAWLTTRPVPAPPRAAERARELGPRARQSSRGCRCQHRSARHRPARAAVVHRLPAVTTIARSRRRGDTVFLGSKARTCSRFDRHTAACAGRSRRRPVHSALTLDTTRTA